MYLYTCTSSLLCVSALIAKRSEANDCNLWASESQLVFTYNFFCISVSHAFLASGGKPHVQNGVLGSYMDAVFEVVAQKEAEIWTILLHRLLK